MLNESHIAALWDLLQERAPLRVIRNDEDYAAVKATADSLADLVGDDVSHPLFPMFDLAMALIDKWKESITIPDVKSKYVLMHLMFEHNLAPAQMKDIASESHIMAILKGSRPISSRLAKKLTKRFNVGISAFI